MSAPVTQHDHYGHAYLVSRTCEYLVRWEAPVSFCDAPTTRWYPAAGGGAMALCAEHARPHASHSYSFEPSEIRRRGTP